MKTAILTVGLVLALAAAEPAQQAGKSEPSTPDLIEQLGDTAFKVRRHAEDVLRGLGGDAVDALTKAAVDHTDPEVRWRAKRLLRAIEKGDRKPGSSRGGLRDRSAVGNRES